MLIIYKHLPEARRRCLVFQKTKVHFCMDHTNLKSLELQAEVNRLSDVSDFVKGVMNEAGCSKAMIGSIDIVVEEVYVNIASYAYDEVAADRPAWVECGAVGDDFYLIFRDMGKEYDPLKKEDPVIGDPMNMTIGGYGIYMVKTIADDIAYKYDRENGQNILTIIKKIEKA